MFYTTVLYNMYRGITMTIKELRKKTDLSQSQFAKKFHLNIRTLQTWEQNTRPTPEHVIYLISSILKYEKEKEN